MKQMTDQEWREFVLAGTRTGKLSTVRADGSPHVVPVWFLLDGDDVVFNTDHGSVKAKNMARDGRFSLCVDSDRPPYAFVTLSGRASLVQDVPDVRDWASRLGARYVGPDQAERYADRNGGELLVRGRIDKVIAFGGITD